MSDKVVNPSDLVETELTALRGELKAVGVDGHLSRTKLRDSPVLMDAVPILIKHLEADYSDMAICLISELLTAKPEASKAVWPKLVDIYRRTEEGVGARYPGDTETFPLMAKDCLANAVADCFSVSYLTDMLDLIAEKRQGGSRILLLRVLRRRRKNPIVAQFLRNAIKDSDLRVELSAWKPSIT